MSVHELPPGNASWPYHFETTEEEWLIVIDGELTLRTPEGEAVLRAGDVACFPAGAKVINKCQETSSHGNVGRGETCMSKEAWLTGQHGDGQTAAPWSGELPARKPAVEKHYPPKDQGSCARPG